MIENSGYFGNQWNEVNARTEAQKFETFVSEGGRGFFMEIYIIEEVYEYYLSYRQKIKARKLLEYAIELHPYVVDFFYKKSCIELEFDYLYQALSDIDQALKIQSFEPRFLIQKARVLSRMQESELALSLLYDALDYVRDPSEIYYQIGQVHFVALKYKQAVYFYAQSLLVDPGREDVLNEIVACFRMMGDLNGGIQFCQEYIDSNPYSYTAWYNLGTIQFDSGLFEAANISFDYSTIIKIDFVTGYQGRARAVAALNKFDLAINFLLESLTYDSNNAETLLLLGECYQSLNQHDQSGKHYRECALYHPNLPQAWYGVGISLLSRKNYLAAASNFRKALEIDSTYYEAWLGVADCEYLLGNLISSYEALQKAVNISPEDLKLWASWAQRLDTDGNIEGALLVLEEGMRLNPNELDLIYRYAAFLFKVGRSTEAFLYLENALLMDFDKHTILYQICPQIMSLLPIQEVIEQYRPRFSY